MINAQAIQDQPSGVFAVRAKWVMLATVLATSAQTASACDLHEDLVKAVQAGNTEDAAKLYETVVVDPDCGDDLRAWAGGYLARESFVFAVTQANTTSDKRDALNRALAYERHWRTFNELGLMAWTEKDYDTAALHFQAAIGELAEGNPSHAAEVGEIAELYEMAAAALALAKNPEIPVTRNGNPGGIFTTKIRGFQVVEVPLPITFEFDSAEFDEEGARIAEALFAYVTAVRPAKISLTGHTDPRGEDDYNLSLSLVRAQAVRDFLSAKGIEQEIVIDGKGESEVPPPPRGIEEGSEEHFRIARRVVFVAQ